MWGVHSAIGDAASRWLLAVYGEMDEFVGRNWAKPISSWGYDLFSVLHWEGDIL